MAKSTTLNDRFGLSDSEKNAINNKYSKPSEEALRFVLDYTKSSSLIKSKALDPFVIVNN